jgi:hypothetical protein
MTSDSGASRCSPDLDIYSFGQFISIYKLRFNMSAKLERVVFIRIRWD